MPPSVLGSYMITFEGDGKGVEKAIQTTEAAASRGAVRIGDSIKAGVESGMRKAVDAARVAGPKLLATYKDLTPALRLANKEAADLSAKISRGAIVNQRDIARVTLAEVRLREQMVATFGSVERATSGATAGYNRVRAAAERATAEARRQRLVFEDARRATTEAGFRYTSLADAASDVARRHGEMGGKVADGIAKVAAASFIAREGANALRSIAAGMSTADTEAWVSKQISAIKKWQNETKTSVYDVTVAWFAYHKARLTGDSDGMLGAARGASGKGLLTPIAPGTSNRSDVAATTAATASAAYDEWKVMELAHLARQKEIVSRRLQLAEIAKSSGAVQKLTAEMALLERKESVLNGQTDSHAATVQQYTMRVLAATQAEAARQRGIEAAARTKAFTRDLSKDAFTSTKAWATETVAGAKEAIDRRTQILIAGLAKEREIEQQRVAIAVATSEMIITNARFEAEMRRTALDRLTMAYVQHAMTTQQVMLSGLGGVEGFLTEVLTPGAIRSFEDIDDAAKDMLRSITAEIARMMAQKAVMWFLSQFGGSATPTVSSMGGLIASSPGVVGSAKGNVLRGGFQAFAKGGIVNRPTLGLIGEGRHNEAVVPLPDGRSIPVEMGGSRAMPVIQIENIWSAELLSGMVSAGAAQGAAQANRQVIRIVAEDYAKNGTIRKMIQVG